MGHGIPLGWESSGFQAGTQGTSDIQTMKTICSIKDESDFIKYKNTSIVRRLDSHHSLVDATFVQLKVVHAEYTEKVVLAVM